MAGVPVLSTMTPSRRKTTRSAHAAWRASWVTTSPAAPASQRSRRTREHLLAGVRVERAGGLVGEDELAVADQCPGDGHPLLLAAGHLVGVAVGQLAHPHEVEGSHGVPAR